MSLFKRNDSSYWWVRFIHNGRRIQHSTGTADQAKAQEYHDRLKASLWDQERLGVKPRRTWNEAVVKYLAETSHKASQSDDRTHLRWVDRFLNGAWLEKIDRDLLDRIMSARKAEGVANSTVNRTLEVVRAVLRRAAYDWDWISKAPRVRMLPEPKRRIRWLTREEAEPCPGTWQRWRGSPWRRFATFQRHGPVVGAGRSHATHRMDSCGPGQGAQGNCGTAECSGCDRDSR